MKIAPYFIASLVGLVLISAAPKVQTTGKKIDFNDQNLVFPENVMAIIENKCMGCHKPDSRNEKAKGKLQWAQLADMETEALIDKLDEIMEELEEGSMPPAKMLEKYPDMKLSDDESTILQTWADENLKRLTGE